jgi:hypothetical protein
LRWRLAQRQRLRERELLDKETEPGGFGLTAEEAAEIDELRKARGKGPRAEDRTARSSLTVPSEVPLACHAVTIASYDQLLEVAGRLACLQQAIAPTDKAKAVAIDLARALRPVPVVFELGH